MANNNKTLVTTFAVNDQLSPHVKVMANNMKALNGQFQTFVKTTSASPNLNGIESIKNKTEGIGDSIKSNIASQNSFTSSVVGTRTAMVGLMSVLAPITIALTSIASLMRAINLTDEYTRVTARLNLMNDGLQTTEALNNKIFASSQRARTSYSAMADNVAKLGILAGDSFKSNDEMIFFAEQLNKQFKISGASLEESKSAMYQLTQAMASGRLQGDEFRSVMENAPLLARAISKEMGIPMGQLKEMASQGVITSDIIKNALINSADETNERFAQIPMTFSDIMQNMENVGKQAFRPVFEMISSVSQSSGFQTAMNVMANALVGLGAIAEGVFHVIGGAIDVIAWMGTVMASGWSVTLGILEAMLPITTVGFATWLGYLTAINIESAITVARTSALAIWNGILATHQAIASGTTMALASAQAILNAVMSLNPIGIVITLIGMLIGVFVACSIATHGLRESIASTWYSMVNTVGWAVNQMIDMINSLIGLLNKVGGTLGKVFGFDYSQIAEVGHVNVEGIAQGGASFIRNFDINNMMKAPTIGGGGGDLNMSGLGGTNSPLSDLGDKAGKTANNTGRMADAVDTVVEDMEELKKSAERDGINRITRQDIKLEIVNHNNVSSEVDLDGIGDSIARSLFNTMKTAREGV